MPNSFKNACRTAYGIRTAVPSIHRKTQKPIPGCKAIGE